MSKEDEIASSYLFRMKSLMTYSAQRNYIKPMFRLVAKIMMVLFGIFSALCALTFCYKWHVTITGLCMNCIFSFSFIWIVSGIFCVAFGKVTFTCCSLAIRHLCSLKFNRMSMLILHSLTMWGLDILIMKNIHTFFAPILDSGRFCPIFVKVRQSLNFLAFRAVLFYDGFRHDCFLIKQLCLGLLAGYIPSVSLPYYRIQNRGFQ